MQKGGAGTIFNLTKTVCYMDYLIRTTPKHLNVPRAGSHSGDLQCLWILNKTRPIRAPKVPPFVLPAALYWLKKRSPDLTPNAVYSDVQAYM